MLVSQDSDVDVSDCEEESDDEWVAPQNYDSSEEEGGVESETSVVIADDSDFGVNAAPVAVRKEFAGLSLWTSLAPGKCFPGLPR